MFRNLFTAALFALPTHALADGYVFGAGRWTCAKAIEVYEAGTPLDKGQLVGWILGYWSHATFSREKGFIDTVEKVGGIKIATATVDECRKAPADLMIFKVADGMIANTK